MLLPRLDSLQVTLQAGHTLTQRVQVAAGHLLAKSIVPEEALDVGEAAVFAGRKLEIALDVERARGSA